MSRKTLCVILLTILFSVNSSFIVSAFAQVDQECEACAMIVSPEAQSRYLVTDQLGTVHYVECFMCALNLVKAYDQVHIVTSCDWFGPSYKITVDSKNFGSEVTVNPSTAVFLNGGSCVINRAGYNQAAAAALLENGYSQFTLSDQRYALPSSTKVSSVLEAALEYGKNTAAKESPQATLVLIAVAAVGAIVIAGSFVAFRKMREPQVSGGK